MTNMPQAKKWLIAFMIITLATNLSACGKKSPDAKPNTSSMQKTPPELGKMKTDLAQLGTMLENRKKTMVKLATPIASQNGQQQAQQGTQSGSQKSGQQSSKNKTEKGTQSSGQQGGNSQTKTASKQGTSEKTATTSTTESSDWQKEMDLVRKLHEDWNSLEPVAVVKNLATATQTGMEESLNALTQAVENKTILPAQTAANRVFGFFVEIEALFADTVTSDLDKMRYHIAEARLQGENNNWTVAGEEVGKTMETWRRLSYAVDPDIDRQLLHKVEHSINDLTSAVAEASLTLTDIKTEIALKNLDDLEKEVKSRAFKVSQ
jgi:hypothetical protein